MYTKRIVVGGLTSIIGYGWIQGHNMRSCYRPVEYVPGPNVGVCSPCGDTLELYNADGHDIHTLRGVPFKKLPFRSRKLVVIGDSMVLGIGMETEDVLNYGPAISASTALTLSKYFDVPYSYQSIGYNGATLQMMEDIVIPELQKIVSESESPLNELILMCGLNDAKDVIYFQSNVMEFQNRFRDLLTKLRSIVGPECKIVVPSYPVNMCVAFNVFPVKYFVQLGMWFWDHQKELVIQTMNDKNISFVKKIDIPSDWREKVKNTPLQGTDGIHPNKLGYELFGICLSRHLIEKYFERT